MKGISISFLLTFRVEIPMIYLQKNPEEAMVAIPIAL